MSESIDPGTRDELIARFEEMLEVAATPAEVQEPGLLSEHVARVAYPEHYVRLLKGEIDPKDYARELERSCRTRATPYPDSDAARRLAATHASEYLEFVRELEEQRERARRHRVEDPNMALSAVLGIARHAFVTTFVAVTGFVLIGLSLATHSVSWGIDFTSVWLGITGVVVTAVMVRWAQQRSVSSVAPRLPTKFQPVKRIMR